jgi:hypothetical protein
MSVLELLKNGADFLFTLDLTTTITYRQDTSTFDENTLMRIESHVDYQITAIETIPKVEEYSPTLFEKAEERVVEPDAIVFVLNGSQITFTPKIRDRIIRGSEQWNIYDIRHDPSESLYRVFAKKV